MDITNEEILKIDDLLTEWAPVAIELGIAVHCKNPIPKEYSNDSIFVEYYNGIYNGRTASEMRAICLPKFIRREMEG